MIMNWIEVVSILAAAMAVSFGAIGPALGERRAVAAAMDAIARQPLLIGVRCAAQRPGVLVWAEDEHLKVTRERTRSSEMCVRSISANSCPR